MAEPKLTLNDWSLWISADEFVGGSFFYAEWIDSTSNSKRFKLWPRVVGNNINARSDWEIIAARSANNNLYTFSEDWYIEAKDTYNEYNPSVTAGGWFWKRTTDWYVNWISIGNDELWGITADKIDVITTTTDLFGTNLVTTPDLTSGTGWTVGTGWTLWASWAQHDDWDWTDTLVQAITTTSGKYYRITIATLNVFAWSCEVKRWSTVLWTITSDSRFWTMYSPVASWASTNLTFTPTDTFNWDIVYVNVNEYDDAKLFPDKVTITSAASHPALLWQWDVYIGSWASIDIVNTTLYDVQTVNIIDEWYTIRSITQIWWSLIIWASDGNNSKQYYWNGVDEVASEVIDRKWMNITNAVSDETKSYVNTAQASRTRMYITNWYQRQCIAKNDYNWRTVEWSKNLYYPNKKFNFYNYNSNSLVIMNEKLYATSYGWIYTYWSDIPWLPSVWNKPIINDPTVSLNQYCIWTHLGVIYYSYKASGVNILGEVRNYNNCTTGYLVCNPTIRDNLSTKKALNKLNIWFKNVDSTIGNIKIYAIVDDDYFWTLSVTGITVTPIAWAVYNVWTNTKAEVISTSITGWVGTITLKTTDNIANYPWNELSTATKVSWTGDTSITVAWFTNMCLIKTITSDQQGYWEELIFWSSFVDTHMPDRHKIQLVVELNSSNSNVSPEVYDISLSSDIVD